MKTLPTKKLDTKKISKMCGLLEELYSDKTPYITEAYLEKTEDLLKVVFDIFVKPEFEDIMPVYPKFDRDDQTFMYKQTHEAHFGYTTSNGHVVINTGILYLAQTKLVPEAFRPYHDLVDNENYERKDLQRQYKDFFAFRNQMIGDLVSTVAHEYRHLMQKIYLELCQSSKANPSLIKKLESKLGACANELKKNGLASLFSDSSEKWMEYEILAEFGLDNNLISNEEYSHFSDQVLRPDTCYELKTHEKDARMFETRVMFEIAKHFRAYHNTIKQMQERALFKQDDLNNKFYKLANARMDFLESPKITIEREIYNRQKAGQITKFSKKIASNLTVEALIGAAKKYIEGYDLVSDADMGFCYALDILLKNKHFETFFKTTNLQGYCQTLKDLDLHISAHRLESYLADIEDENEIEES